MVELPATVGPAVASASAAPQQQSPVVAAAPAAAPAAAAAAYALQQQSSVVPAKPGGTRKAKAKAAPKNHCLQLPCRRFCIIASASAESAGKLDSFAHR